MKKGIDVTAPHGKRKGGREGGREGETRTHDSRVGDGGVEL